MQCYTSVVYAVALCLSVYPIVSLSQVSIVPKWQSVESQKQCRTIAQAL